MITRFGRMPPSTTTDMLWVWVNILYIFEAEITLYGAKLSSLWYINSRKSGGGYVVGFKYKEIGEFDACKAAKALLELDLEVESEEKQERNDEDGNNKDN